MNVGIVQGVGFYSKNMSTRFQAGSDLCIRVVAVRRCILRFFPHGARLSVKQKTFQNVYPRIHSEIN